MACFGQNQGAEDFLSMKFWKNVLDEWRKISVRDGDGVQFSIVTAWSPIPGFFFLLGEDLTIDSSKDELCLVRALH